MSLHVHWPTDLNSGSHRPPEAFRKNRSLFDRVSNSVTSTFQSATNTVTSFFASSPQPAPLTGERTLRIPQPPCHMRKEVPFERWFAHYSTMKDVPCRARAWALASSADGFFQLVKEVVKIAFYSLTCNSKASALHQEILRAQWQGYQLSVQAIFSPAATITLIKATCAVKCGIPLIGTRTPVSKWTCGTNIRILLHGCE